MHRKWIAAALGAAFLGIVGLRAASALRERQRDAAKPSGTAVVTTARAMRGDVPEQLGLTGNVRPRNEVDVAARVGGRIEAVLAQVGDRVSRGQVLATIEHRELAWQAQAADAAVAVARASLEGARLERERADVLVRAGSISIAQADAVRVKHELALAQLAQAEASAGLAAERVANARIEAPISGTVTRRPVDVGANVTPLTTLFTIQDVTSVKVESSVSPAVFSRLRVEAPATITADELPGRVFRGRVVRISPSLDPQTRRAPVEILVERADGLLVPNSFVRADLTVAVLSDVVVIPREAIQETSEGPTVFRIAGGRAESIHPRLGPRDGARAAVLDGLAAGDEVVVRGAATLAPGTEVQVASSPAGARASASP